MRILIFKFRVIWFYIKFQFWIKKQSRSEIDAYQEREIRKHIDWVRAQSPFLSELWGNIPADKWRELPISNKAMMMEQFTTWNTIGAPSEELFRIAFESERSRDFSPMYKHHTVGLSSGTSGQRGLFLVTELERARYAGMILARALPGGLKRTHRVAFFMRANSNLYTGSKNRKLEFQYFDIFENLDSHLERLQALNPTLLISPVSTLLKLREKIESGALKLSPERVFAVAEPLSKEDAQRLESTFKQPIYQFYQCTEGFIAISCEKNSLHVNEEAIHIEPQWLDETRTRFMPIVTDFSRKAQPITRFLLNDILTWSDQPCACGKQTRVIASIEGRIDDIITIDTRDYYPDYFRRVIAIVPTEIREYWVIQTKLLEIKVIVSLKNQSEFESAREQILSGFSELRNKHPKLAIEVEAGVYPNENKKLRRVMNLSR
ncbi:MAG: hypothetical protein KA715_06565 [Xanthomonadaceae bacterium]|nr:hypothetical protein [Xanthomonadaceae bacterium]